MKKLQLCILFLLMPITAFAHQAGTESAGLFAGVLHPLSGLDHLLAMVAVGLWASQMGQKAAWTLPSTFITAMIAGVIVAMAGVSVPYVETGILLSVLVLGGLIATAWVLPTVFSIGIVGSFALFHGYAHGSEVSAVSMAYIAGFVVSTAFLHATGVFSGLFLRQLNSEKIARFAGGLITLTGLYLVFA